MADSGDSIAVDMETIYLGGKEHIVRTGHGYVSVIVYGDEAKPPLITYPDKALNHISCFEGLFFCSEAVFFATTQFLHLSHHTPPGHELGPVSICPDDPIPSIDDLCDQLLEVLNHLRLGAVMCMGVMAGAYLLTLFAIRYRDRVTGLILISPLCKAPSWTEWLYNKEVRSSQEIPESDIVHACRKLLDERQSINVLRFLHAIDTRPDITEGLKRLKY